jgi:ferredoxin--NADP+ reductase
MTQSTHLRAVVSSRHDVSPELWIIRLAPEEPVSFQAGQYVTVGVQDGQRTVERPYSVASSPRETELEFFVELVPDGKLTPHLYDVPKGGEVTLRRAAKGRFLFDRESGHAQHFMVATVTGVAPFRSVLRDLAAAEAFGEPVTQQIALLHAASIPSGFGYHDDLSEFARRHNWFRYIPTISRVWRAPHWTGETGRAEDVLRKHLDTLGFVPSQTTVYLCGNPQMIRNAREILLRAGFAKSSIKEEQYWVSPA